MCSTANRWLHTASPKSTNFSGPGHAGEGAVVVQIVVLQRVRYAARVEFRAGVHEFGQGHGGRCRILAAESARIAAAEPGQFVDTLLDVCRGVAGAQSRPTRRGHLRRVGGELSLQRSEFREHPGPVRCGAPIAFAKGRALVGGEQQAALMVHGDRFDHPAGRELGESGDEGCFEGLPSVVLLEPHASAVAGDDELRRPELDARLFDRPGDPASFGVQHIPDPRGHLGPPLWPGPDDRPIVRGHGAPIRRLTVSSTGSNPIRW